LRFEEAISKEENELTWVKERVEVAEKRAGDLNTILLAEREEQQLLLAQWEKEKIELEMEFKTTVRELKASKEKLLGDSEAQKAEHALELDSLEKALQAAHLVETSRVTAAIEAECKANVESEKSEWEENQLAANAVLVERYTSEKEEAVKVEKRLTELREEEIRALHGALHEASLALEDGVKIYQEATVKHEADIAHQVKLNADFKIKIEELNKELYLKEGEVGKLKVSLAEKAEEVRKEEKRTAHAMLSVATSTPKKEDLRRVQSQVEEYEARLEEMESQNRDLAREVSKKEEEMTVLQRTISELEVEFVEVSDRVGPLEVSLAHMQSENGRLQSQLSDFEGQVRALKAQVETLQTALTDSMEYSEEANQEIQEIRSKVLELQGEIRGLEQKVEAASAELAQARIAEEESINKAAQLEAILNSQLNEMQSEMTHLQKDMQKKAMAKINVDSKIKALLCTVESELRDRDVHSRGLSEDLKEADTYINEKHVTIQTVNLLTLTLNLTLTLHLRLRRKLNCFKKH